MDIERMEGIKAFLMDYKKLHLNKADRKKIGVLKRVIQIFDGAIETINFGDLDEGC